MSGTDTPDCPLCMEAFEIDDIHFYPCTCGYQICRFCWHRIRTDENGLCPACRKTYTEDPAMYRPLSQDEVQKIKKEQKQKETQHKQKISANRQHLSNIRVIQKHLVFVVGLSNKLADIEILKRPEYFGKYGKIVKIVINPNTNYAGPQGPSASAYITYTREEDALKAILSINNTQPPLKIRASLGTTKYCTHYLRNQQCPKTDCMYLHDVGDGEASFTKEDMQAGKHQTFEKNLLDDYVSSVQEQRQLQKSVSISSEPDQLDTNSQEDWSDELDNADSMLPSQASWGTSKEDKHINNIRSFSTSHKDEYPELDSSCKITPNSSPPISENVLQASSQPLSESLEEQVEPVPKQVCDEEIANSARYPPGWKPSTEQVNMKTSEPETATNPLSSWPGICDLGLTDLQINPSDDELGFDPFNESKSALEDLMASEKQQGVPSTSQPQPSYSWDSFWPSSYSANHSQSSQLSSYSLFGASQQMSHQHMMQYRAPAVNPYAQSSIASKNSLGMNAPNMAAQFRFMAPQQAQVTPQANQPMANQIFHAQHQQQFFNQLRFQQFQPQQPPTGTSQPAVPASQQAPPTVSTTTLTSTTSISTDNKNWQDGLRALLPNINISFANQGYDEKYPAKSVDQDVPYSNVSTPPPGFNGFSGLPAKPVEKTSRPPPGFSKPSTDVFLPTNQPPPGILKLTPSQMSASQQQPAASDIESSSASVAPDDPSILWSKVLSDKHKDIENNSDMAFPLPGETGKQGSSIEVGASRAPLQQPPLSMASWNTIVSGNQGNKMKTHGEELLKQHQQRPLQVTSKENLDMGKPQKPSPIFGTQMKQAFKKPTAHVKPLKSNAMNDGFTTVQNSRQSVAQQNSSIHTGSRVSELDDFGTDFPIAASLNHSAGISAVDMSLYEMSSASKVGAKKKKKKTKEQVEQISEIIVGRVEAERPPVCFVDDERPKKNKAKKKSSQKASPPQQRKISSPLLSIYDHQKMGKDQQPTIRILKTDGNHSGTTIPSPVQAMAPSESTKQTVVHDHEIVSRLTESTEKLLKNVLFETEAIKINTEQISKDLKSALEKCKESSLSLSDLEKINLLLTPGKLPIGDLDDPDLVDTYDLERQVESARREAKMLEARLNDVIRKNMASELETLKRNTKGNP